MRVSVATVLAAPLDRVAVEVRRPQLLVHIAAPMIVFEPIAPPYFPDQWTPGRYLVRMKLFGVLPFGKQWVVIQLPPAGADEIRMRDNGYGDVARRWDHLITLRARADGGTDYRDDIDIEGGLMTPGVWAFAALFYRHRQRRWRRLVARGFAYD